MTARKGGLMLDPWIIEEIRRREREREERRREQPQLPPPPPPEPVPGNADDDGPNRGVTEIDIGGGGGSEEAGRRTGRGAAVYQLL